MHFFLLLKQLRLLNTYYVPSTMLRDLCALSDQSHQIKKMRLVLWNPHFADKELESQYGWMILLKLTHVENFQFG